MALGLLLGAFPPLPPPLPEPYAFAAACVAPATATATLCALYNLVSAICTKKRGILSASCRFGASQPTLATAVPREARDRLRTQLPCCPWGQADCGYNLRLPGSPGSQRPRAEG